LAAAAISYHPDSKAARAAGRLTYLAASIVCESLDFVSVGAAFRTFEERRELILNAVRYGALSSEQGQRSLKLGLALVSKYAPGGKSTAAAVESGLKTDLEKIPAEIVADQAMRLLKSDQLFSAGRELEMASYQHVLPPFDRLSVSAKSIVGALLDYAGIDRERFATTWKAHEEVAASEASSIPRTDVVQETLFGDRK
jgi:hypothetical protein